MKSITQEKSIETFVEAKQGSKVADMNESESQMKSISQPKPTDTNDESNQSSKVEDKNENQSFHNKRSLQNEKMLEKNEVPVENCPQEQIIVENNSSPQISPIKDCVFSFKCKLCPKDFLGKTFVIGK